MKFPHKKKENNKKWKTYSNLKLMFGSLFLILIVMYVRTFLVMVNNQQKQMNDRNSDVNVHDTTNAVSSYDANNSNNYDKDKTNDNGEMETIRVIANQGQSNDKSYSKLLNVDRENDAIDMMIQERTHQRKDNDHHHEKEQLEQQKAHEQELLQQVQDHEQQQQQNNVAHVDVPPVHQRPKLKAYIEKIDQSQWNIKPLPTRQTTSSALDIITYDNVSSCTKLPEQFPIDEEVAPTNKDPFLPWIHDVFPTADGKYIQFIAQNKRRCQSGSRKKDIKKFFQPNIALFQHVPIKRIQTSGTNNTYNSPNETRYKLTSHEDADVDGVETRFICRFKPTMQETLSVFNFNYDYHTVRKAYSATFTEEGFDNHMIWSSQFLFKCPVPPSLQETIRTGKSVIDDYATLFVDIIPIRTPPRYGLPTTYLPPRLFADKNTWDVQKEWGDNHILPSIEDSGRWENIPICKPSLMTYPDELDSQEKITLSQQDQNDHDDKMASLSLNNEKKHNLISCTWTSAAFKTRGGRTMVNDGQERLKQWLEFNRLVGVDHVYIYDNSGSFSDDTNLKVVTDLFPGYVTRINWPAKVCNNNRGNVDNKGERSSQYAADASCRLRFGAHSTWLASHDTDEYLVPLEKYKDLKELLANVEMNKEDIKVLNFQSKRSKPRLRYLNSTYIGDDPSCPTRDCFDPSLDANQTFLQVYNCNIERPPRKELQPAEKAIYKPDYVLQFFVHYATVTTRSALGKPETEARKMSWRRRYDTRLHHRYVDETTEATMLHTKAIVSKETKNWHNFLTRKDKPQLSQVGVEWPVGSDGKDTTLKVEINGDSLYPNCFPVEWIENHWSPKLNEAMKRHSS